MTATIYSVDLSNGTIAGSLVAQNSPLSKRPVVTYFEVGRGGAGPCAWAGEAGEEKVARAPVTHLPRMVLWVGHESGHRGWAQRLGSCAGRGQGVTVRVLGSGTGGAAGFGGGKP